MKKNIPLLIAVIGLSTGIGVFLNLDARPHWPEKWHLHGHKHDYETKSVPPRSLTPGEVFSSDEKAVQTIESNRNKQDRLRQQENELREQKLEKDFQKEKIRRERQDLKQETRKLKARL